MFENKIKELEWVLWTLLVHALRDRIRRGRGTRDQGRTPRGRLRDSGVGWMEGGAYGGLCVGLDGQAKVPVGWISVDKLVERM